MEVWLATKQLHDQSQIDTYIYVMLQMSNLHYHNHGFMESTNNQAVENGLVYSCI